MKTQKLLAILSVALLLVFSNNVGAQGLKGDKDDEKKNSSSTGGGSYKTALGLRGGWTSGLTLKHFIKSNSAIEIILGSRWHGFNIAGLYEWHKGNALNIPELSWEYGIGARVGFYNGSYYYNNCDDPWDNDCNGYYNRSVVVVGLMGIGGLEYKFKEIPFTISLDLMPYYDFTHWGGGFIDGSVSLRYIIK